MRRFGTLLLGLACASAITAASALTAAQAQTVISRQITTEQVETVVTQGPNGTVVSRRPLGAAPVASPVYPPAGNVVETVETVEQPAATTVTREVIRRRAAETQRARTSSRQTVRDQRGNTKVVQRVVTRQVATPMALTPEERRVVYRTIVRERVVPSAPMVTREIVTPPAPRAEPLYPRVTAISNATPAYVEPAGTYVGTALPRDVVFYDVPASVRTTMLGTRPYRYAYVGDRVLLVDPVTRLVVEDVTE